MTNHRPDLNALVHQMDNLRPTYRPLSPHFATGVDAHVRLSYGVMLVAVALGKGTLSQRTVILLELVLDALGLNGQSAQVLAQANSVDVGVIQEFLDLAKRDKLSAAFMVDAIVLCCVDGPLAEEQQALLAEMADFLEIPESQMSRITFWAGHILGCPVQARLHSSYLKTVTLEKRKRDFSAEDLTSTGNMMRSWAKPKYEPEFKVAQLPTVGTAVRKAEIICQTNERYLNSKMVKLIAKCPADGVLVDVLVGGKDKVTPDQKVVQIATLPDYCAAWRPVLGFEDLDTTRQREAS